MIRLSNRFRMCVPWVMLSAVMLVVSVAAQPAQAEQQPDTLLRETIEQLLDSVVTGQNMKPISVSFILW